MIIDLQVPLACVTLVVALNLGILATVFTRLSLDQGLSYSGKTYCMFLLSSVAHSSPDIVFEHTSAMTIQRGTNLTSALSR